MPPAFNRSRPGMLPGRVMSPEVYKFLIRRFGLTQHQAGLFLGRASRTGDTWAATGPPPEAAMLLIVMDAMNIAPDEVNRIIKNWLKGERA